MIKPEEKFELDSLNNKINSLMIEYGMSKTEALLFYLSNKMESFDNYLNTISYEIIVMNSKINNKE